MSNRQPNFAVGDEIVYLSNLGIVKRVINDGKGNYSYMVEFEHGKQKIHEGRMKRA